MRSELRNDPELGVEKRCTSCREWWPLDEDFWYVKSYEVGEVAYAGGKSYVRQTAGRHWFGQCRACWSDRSAARYAARKAS